MRDLGYVTQIYWDRDQQDAFLRIDILSINLCRLSSFYIVGVFFVGGRSLYIRAGNSTVQSEPIVSVTAATEASRETSPTI